MNTHLRDQTLEELLNNPESWLRQAEQQYLVAESIAPQVRPNEPGERGLLRSVGTLKTVVLLLALSIENAFKAVKASRGGFTVDARGLVKNSLGGGRTGHGLVALAEDIGISLTTSDTLLLQRLTEIGIWAGKYHTPIFRDALERAINSNPRLLNIPSDFVSVQSLLIRAADMAGVSLVTYPSFSPS
jgi:hypothetical protein